MAFGDKFCILRGILKALGLSEEAIEDIVERICSILYGDEREDEKESALPFRSCESILTAAEQSFFQVLRRSLPEEQIACPKVSLKDLFVVSTNDARQRVHWRNRIDQKHIDFLVCDARTLEPLAGIELDDSSHARASRQQRDDFVNRVFGASQLPLLRIPVRQGYTPTELSQLLRASV